MYFAARRDLAFAFVQSLPNSMIVIRQLRSHMDFGPVVRPLGITVKKEAGKVVETSGDMM